MAADASPPPSASKHEKKPKKDKSTKKRAREDDDVERKSKKTKSVSADASKLAIEASPEPDAKQEKQRNKNKNKDAKSKLGRDAVAEHDIAPATEAPKADEKNHGQQGEPGGESERTAEVSAVAENYDTGVKHRKRKIKDEDVAVSDKDIGDSGGKKHKTRKSKTKDTAVPDGAIEDSSEKKRKKRKDKDKDAAAQDAAVPDGAIEDSNGKKHKKKKDATVPDAAVEDGTRKKHKKRDNKGEDADIPDDATKDMTGKKQKQKRSKKHAGEDGKDAAAVPADADAMDVDPPEPSQPRDVYQPPDMPANPQFPFFSQTVSLYRPLYPIGWAQPVTNSQHQHLQLPQDKYVPSLRGVLLGYKDVAIGPVPGRDGAATDDDMPTTVLSRNEYGVGFAWITADVELFVPSRGAWMEGSVNLQTEGHIGVVCFGKFNASIEARRLPPAWKWVSNESPDAHGFEETASVMTAGDDGVVHQIHSTGFWVDAGGAKVKGKIRFRIRNFDAGTSGDMSYLSLEGTMLDKESEKVLVNQEARTAQMRREKKGGHKIERRRAPDFGTTRFENADTEQAQAPGVDAKPEP